MTTADRYALRGFPPRTLTDRSAEQKKTGPLGFTEKQFVQ